MRRMSASKAGAFVLYSFAQSARTPRRLNCAVCLAIQTLGERVAELAQLGGRDLPSSPRGARGRPSARSAARGSPSRARTGVRKPAHRLVADRHVLERLVERGADVDVAVRERRAVVQDEDWGARAPPLDRVVEARLLPMGHPRRLALREARPHGKIRPGQLQGVFEVLRQSKKRVREGKCAPR